jgi:hypothetical protein
MSEEAHEWHCPDCGATTRARMADHPPGGEELRDELIEGIPDRYVSNPAIKAAIVDHLLDLLAVRDALAAQEKVRRVRVVADELRGITGAGSWRYSDAASQIRRALDGDS